MCAPAALAAVLVGFIGMDMHDVCIAMCTVSRQTIGLYLHQADSLSEASQALHLPKEMTMQISQFHEYMWGRSSGYSDIPKAASVHACTHARTRAAQSRACMWAGTLKHLTCPHCLAHSVIKSCIACANP